MNKRISKYLFITTFIIFCICVVITFTNTSQYESEFVIHYDNYNDTIKFVTKNKVYYRTDRFLTNHILIEYDAIKNYRSIHTKSKVTILKLNNKSYD